MSNGDRWAIALCASVGLASLLAVRLPLLVVLIAILIAVLTRHRWLVCAALAMTASILSAHAWTSLDTPVPDEINGVATIIQDPTKVSHATRAEVRLDGRHYVLWAYGSAAYQLQAAAAGEHIHVEGPTAALSGVSAPSLRRRHIAASVNVTACTFVDHGNALARAANGVRTLISRGSRFMAPTERALLSGFVYGDDRADTAAMQSDFRNSGLSHLLAVSGENVAFVLVLTVPLLKRCSLRGRFFGGLAVLVLFGVVTRWEPSVVRAEFMASVALFAVLLGRPISTWRCLGLGSTIALLVDPFLVGSVGFLLSVSACAGMATLGPPLFARLRGPSWLARAVGYSAAAQLGVMPVQFAVFGSVPTVGLLTNVLAEPVAGLVMVWGVVGGLTAGVISIPLVQELLHTPDGAMLWFIALVAASGAYLEARLWGQLVGVLGSLLILIAMFVPKAPSTLEDRDGDRSAIRVFDKG